MQPEQHRSRAVGLESTIHASVMRLVMAALFAIALIVGAMTADASAQGVSPGMTSSDADYRLGSGDHVRVTVFGEQDLSGDYQVDGAGKLAFPLIGQIDAGGFTASDLQTKLSAALSPSYVKNPSVSVEVLTYRPFYIVGEVRTPGSYPYVAGMAVINGVALAGGFTYRAKQNDFYLTRTVGSQKVRLDADPETPVQAGDVITVRERFF
jgi:protein involved in polysaccharide export with SLBB domain